MKTSMQSTNMPRPPVPSNMDVCDLGRGSGPPRLHTGGAKNLWVKKNHHTRGERLKIATYNVRTSPGNSIVAELVLRITDRYQLKIVQVYAPTTSHSDEETDNFYNTIDKILEKQTHYTIVMGDFNAKVGGQTNTSASAWASEMKEETLL